ncbi:MAG: hypothetical protein HY711_05715 [Candidatus Melainabacteria bacterium]|nr:hypothetical protein [Candidatus Melainabacteria bacterium]
MVKRKTRRGLHWIGGLSEELRCQELNKRGKRCGMPRLKGEAYCRKHQPGCMVTGLSGKASALDLAETAPVLPMLPSTQLDLKTLDDCLAWLSTITREVRQGKLNQSVANTLRQLLQVFAHAH